MPQLDPTWFVSQLFWLLAAFVTLYVVLSRVALPPLLEMLERRRQTVESDVQTAQSCKTQAEQAKEQYERALADARSRAQQVQADAMAEYKTQSEKLSRDMDAQTAAKLQEAGKRIRAKKQELLDSLTPTSAELAAMIVEKLTKQTPSSERLKAIVSDLAKTRNG